MNRAYDRLHRPTHILESPYGDIEYTQRGSGEAVLVIHGSGGGYDQGELIAEAVLGNEFSWITPSRFGYLASTIPEDATWDDQAHAYAHLLDHLGIQRIAVVAMSHGGPSALLFAVLHPDRVSSLTLISCGVAASSATAQAQANRKGDRLAAIYRHDLAYWSVSELFRRQFMTLLGANDVTRLNTAQRELVDRVIEYMNPASLRLAGVVFDNRATLPGERIAAITAPTLIIHAMDDTLQLFDNAEFAASRISGAELVAFERGGHIVMVTEESAIRARIRKHILNHLRTTPELR
jgi:pimeloyl-ACP methyl ester carboxylesterase